MEKIFFKEGSSSTTIFIDPHTYYGYTINNNSIKPFVGDLSSIFSCFFLSKKHSPFHKEGKYFVCTDYLSGFKHYFFRGKEDYYQFFIHNGTPAVVYKGDDHPFNLNDLRFFSFGEKVVVFSFLALLYFSAMIPSLAPNPKEFVQDVVVASIQDYSLDQIRNAIYASPFLTNAEKNYLYNPEFLSMVIDTVNHSYAAKSQFSSYFQNISIESYEPDNDKGPTGGLYRMSTPSTLYVNSYHGLSDGNKDTVSHEFVHLCQDIAGYNLIIEACAEIISSEFYTNSRESAYSSQVRLVKKIMEIIGSEPLWEYNFTGDFSKIDEAIRPYFSEEDYSEFLNCLSFDYDNELGNLPKYDRLNELIGILYQNKYHDDIKNNPIFYYIDHGVFNLKRYYFNPQLKNESYYLDYTKGEYKEMSYQEAMDNGMLTIFANKKTPVDRDLAIEFANNKKEVILRDVAPSDGHYSIVRSNNDSYKLFVSIIVNGVRFEDVDIDQLAKDGLVDVDYYIVKQKELTYEEYINHNYWEDAELLYLKASSTELKDDCVYGFVPKKIVLPPVGESDFSKQKVLY